jgi:hypothetical protein
MGVGAVRGSILSWDKRQGLGLTKAPMEDINHEARADLQGDVIRLSCSKGACRRVVPVYDQRVKGLKDNRIIM